MSAPGELATTLAATAPSQYVRFVADWMSHANDLHRSPGLTGISPADALVAAATAHVALSRGLPVPAWTNEPERYSSVLWYAGPDVLFPNALVHSPLSFFLHGVLVEAESLVSV